MHVYVGLGLLLAVGLQAVELQESAAPVVEGAHVRGLDPAIQRLIDIGLLRSPTFRRVVNELNTSDVVVHLVRGTLPHGFRGFLSHRIIVSSGVRYVRISVDPRGAEARVIGLVAHEVQHALEVARVREVGRSLDVEEFFRSIADQGCRSATCFETSAAVAVQDAVTRELE